jgi:DNA polymerase elongation subunit (family B)
MYPDSITHVHGLLRARALSDKLKINVLKLISLRQKDLFRKKLYKLIINQIYGRLGVRTEYYKTEVKVESDINNILNNRNIKRFKNYKSIFLLEYYDHTSKLGVTNVGIAAAITSKARVTLNKLINRVTTAGGRVIYSDTDSILALPPKENTVEFFNLVN